MKTSVKTGLTGFVMCAAMVVSQPSLADQIVIVADPWCPFNCEPGSDKPGYMVEIAREVFEPLGHTVTYNTVNWSRALVETRDGKYSAVFGAAVGDAEDFVFPGVAQGQAGNALFVRKDDTWAMSAPEDLSGKVVGLIRDYDYGELNDDIQKYAKADYAGGDNALTINIKKLAAGRLDVVVEEASVFNYTADQMGVLDQTRMEKAIEYDDVFIAFSPARAESKELAAQLEAGMEQLRESGRLAEILKKYGLSDWQ